MAINETISTGNKYRRLKDATNKVWQRLSFWTKASDVEFDNGSTAEEALGSITGITDSVNSTSSNVAASAKAVSTLNSNLTNVSTAADNINLYVGDDGKLHWVNKAGADSALNFSSGKYVVKTFNVYKNGGSCDNFADFDYGAYFNSYDDFKAHSIVALAGATPTEGNVGAGFTIYNGEAHLSGNAKFKQLSDTSFRIWHYQGVYVGNMVNFICMFTA